MLEYKSTIKSKSFLYKETKKAAELVNTGVELQDLSRIAIEENIFVVESEARKRELASTISTRLKSLDTYLIQKICTSNIETSKLIVVYAIMKTDRLFFEFINEVFKEKIILKDLYIKDNDFNTFFQNKREQSPKVNSWRDYTFKKLKQVYIRVLFEGGLITSQTKDRCITVPIIEQETVDYIISKGDKAYINALLGINE